MKNTWLGFFLVIIALGHYKTGAQVSLTTAPYTQNFGTANITSWTDNSTFPGWYMSSTFRGYANTASAVNGFNSGGHYTYNCGSDAKIGSRGSGSSPNNNIYYGVVCRNNTGSTIRSFRVSYKGYQMTLAENGGAVNTLEFSYATGTTAPAVNAAGTVVSGLTFTQLQSSGIAGSNQIQWYPCTQSITKSACIPLTLANGNYVLFRWYDRDDASNDHHMAIDDIYIEFDITGNACAIILPVELTGFWADAEKPELKWQTVSEKNADRFIVQKSLDSENFEDIGIVKATNNATGSQYSYYDYSGSESQGYYRLRMVDFDGRETFSDIIYVDYASSKGFSASLQGENLVFKNYEQDVDATIELTDLPGSKIESLQVPVGQTLTVYNRANLQPGLYLARLKTGGKTETIKIIIP
ncbi:MAG TPA: T9SS type A sorting domain-containing protein [Bacteroidia bacterium]